MRVINIVRRVLPKSTKFVDCTRSVSCCIFVSVSEGDAFVSRRAFVSGVSDATEGRDDAAMRGEGPAKKSKSKSNRKTKDLQASAELRRHTRRLAARQILQLSCTAPEAPLSVAQNLPIHSDAHQNARRCASQGLKMRFLRR